MFATVPCPLKSCGILRTGMFQLAAINDGFVRAYLAKSFNLTDGRIPLVTRNSLCLSKVYSGPTQSAEFRLQGFIAMIRRRGTSGPTKSLADATRNIETQEAIIRQGGNESGRQRQKQLGRLTARERLEELLDEGACGWSSVSGRPGRCIPNGVMSRRPAS